MMVGELLSGAREFIEPWAKLILLVWTTCVVTQYTTGRFSYVEGHCCASNVALWFEHSSVHSRSRFKAQPMRALAGG